MEACAFGALGLGCHDAIALLHGPCKYNINTAHPLLMLRITQDGSKSAI